MRNSNDPLLKPEASKVLAGALKEAPPGKAGGKAGDKAGGKAGDKAGGRDSGEDSDTLARVLGQAAARALTAVANKAWSKPCADFRTMFRAIRTLKQTRLFQKPMKAWINQ